MNVPDQLSLGNSELSEAPGFCKIFWSGSQKNEQKVTPKVTASTHLHSPFLFPSLPGCSLQEGNVLSPALNTLWVTLVLFCSNPVFIKLHFHSWTPSVIPLTSLPQYFHQSLSFRGTYRVSPTARRITSPRHGSLPLLATSEL